MTNSSCPHRKHTIIKIITILITAVTIFILYVLMAIAYYYRFLASEVIILLSLMNIAYTFALDLSLEPGRKRNLVMFLSLIFQSALFLTTIIRWILVSLIDVVYAALSTALIFTFYTLPGFLVLKIVGAKKERWNRVELFLYSNILSLFISALLGTISLFINIFISLYIYIVMVLIGLSLIMYLALTILRSLHVRSFNFKEKILSHSSSSVILVEIFLFFLITLLSIYPSRAVKINSDGVRHYSFLWLLTKFLLNKKYGNVHYIGLSSKYLHFYLSQVFIFYIVNFVLLFPREIFVTSMITYMDILQLFAFYFLAKCYFSFEKQTDKRYEIMALMMFVTFAGFGWINALATPRLLDALLLRFKNDVDEVMRYAPTRSFYDVLHANSFFILMLSYRPLNLIFMVFFTLTASLFQIAYSQRENKLQKFVTVIGIALLILFHISEFAFFILVLLSVVLLLRTQSIVRTGLVILSFGSILSLSILIPINLLNGALKVDTLVIYVVLLTLSSYVFFSLLFATIIYLKQISLVSLRKRLSKKLFSFFIRYTKALFQRKYTEMFLTYFYRFLVIISVVSVFYTLVTLDHPLVVDSNGWKYVMSIPLHVYIYRVGVVLLLLICFAAFNRCRTRNEIKIISYTVISAVVFVVIFGRIASFINVNIGKLHFWEYRILPCVFSFGVLIASEVCVNIFCRAYKLFCHSSYGIRKKWRKSKPLFIVLLISFILFNSVSTNLSIVYSKRAVDLWQLNYEEREMIDYINNYYLKNVYPPSIIITFSMLSWHVGEFIPQIGPYGLLKDFVVYRLVGARTPEFVLNYLASLASCAWILEDNYLDAEVIGQINSYIVSYLMPYLNRIYLSPSGKIILYKIPKLAPPIRNSDIALVIPKEIGFKEIFAYNILSLSNVSYTVTYLDDLVTLKDADALVAPSEKIASYVLSMTNMIELNRLNTLVILNVDGYKEFSGKIYVVENRSVLSQNITHEDGGVVAQLPVPIETPPISILWKNATVIARIGSIPFIIKLSHRNVNIYYVNVFPLISSIKTSEDPLKRELWYILGEILTPLIERGVLKEYTYVPYNFVKDGIILPEFIDAWGSIVVNSSSIILEIPENSRMTIRLGSRKLEISNAIVSVLPDSNSYISLNATKLQSSGGHGLYMSAQLWNVSAVFSGTVKISIPNNSQMYEIVGEDIYLYCDYCISRIRTPHIKIDGTTHFSEFRYKLLRLRSLFIPGIKLDANIPQGCEVTVSGGLEFYVECADKFFVIRDFKLFGEISTDPPYYKYDEIRPLKNVTIYSVAVFVIVLVLEQVIIRRRIRKG